MWSIIYENKLNNTVILEYWFTSKIEQRRLILDSCEDFKVIWCAPANCGSWLKAFWRCLIGYSTSRKINE